jgi:uncharacterized C2H2 Zn-finger protein
MELKKCPYCGLVFRYKTEKEVAVLAFIFRYRKRQ